jgi:hypothetical protein
MQEASLAEIWRSAPVGLMQVPEGEFQVLVLVLQVMLTVPAL